MIAPDSPGPKNWSFKSKENTTNIFGVPPIG